MYLDYDEMQDWEGKWAGVRFFIPNHPKYFAGRFKESRYRSGFSSLYIVVDVDLLTQKGVETRLCWLATTGHRTDLYLLDEKEEALIDFYTSLSRYVPDYREDGLEFRLRSGRRVKFCAVKELEIDLTFPDTGLVTLQKGIHKGATFFLSRRLVDSQLRGCCPTTNLNTQCIDKHLLSLEMLPMHHHLSYEQRESLYNDLYYSLVYTKSYTVKEAVEHLKTGKAYSVALNHKFALQLGLQERRFILYHNMEEVGTVTAAGEVLLAEEHTHLMEELAA
jgi:hypothetical protein